MCRFKTIVVKMHISGPHSFVLRHRCQEVCCMGRGMKNYEGHLCTLLCDKMLPCGRHTCDSLCHTGRCPPCSVTLREGISCACGAWFHPGPIRCGSVQPDCRLPCSKPRPCGHPCPKKCHFGDCPPCTVLVTKWCAGRHSKNFATSVLISCGLKIKFLKFWICFERR